MQLDAFLEAIEREGAPKKHVTLARDVVSLVQASDRSLQHGGASVEADGAADMGPHPGA